jgi:adenylate cyclase
MPSLVPGFEYDLFISYRHNDNRSGWVTEFVKALQEELKATIKEPITIYFDKDPHDGLLENYNVDKSLEAKLKCLVFIPIVSQTYCDPKSFAWRQEFCSFNKLSKEDTIGRDVRLGNGNVTSRILPVKVHDLDLEDGAIIEHEIGGPLRGIDFIFKTPGVNRPLRTHEDNPQDNLNKTFYRDQVNKVANAVKQIIMGITKPTAANTINKAGVVHTPESTHSIAVLPFVNMSSDPEQEYFSDGLTEEVINLLTQIKDLKVIARTSVFTFKAQHVDIREIAKKLGVDHVLEGSVRKSANHLRITVQLIRADEGTHIWSERYDRKLEDVFAIQDEISRAIVEKFRIELLAGELPAIARKHSSNLIAYNLYLKGRYFWNKWTPPDFIKSIALFEQAVELDRGYAMAHAALAEARFNLGIGYFGIKPGDMIQEAIKSAKQALLLDNNLAEAHATLGAIKLWNEFDFAGAEKEINLSISLNPNSARARDVYSNLLLAKGEFGKALQEAEKAIELDPLSNMFLANGGIAYYRARKFDQSVSCFNHLQEIHPSLYLWCLVALPYIELGRFSEAIQAFKTFDENVSNNSTSTFLAYAYAKSGERKEAQAILLKLEAKRKNEYLWEVAIAMVYTALGEFDQAMHLLEKAYDEQVGWIHWLKVEPAFDALRDIPRFKALIRKIGLVPTGSRSAD